MKKQLSTDDRRKGVKIVKFLEQKLERRIQELNGLRYREVRELNHVRLIPDIEELDIARQLAATANTVCVGDHWGGSDKYAWFITMLEFPPDWKDKDTVGLLRLGEASSGGTRGCEAQVYLDGQLWQGLSRNHAELFFPQSVMDKGSVELAIYAWSGLRVPDGRSSFMHRIEQLELAVLDENVDDLYYTSLHALQTAQRLDENRPEKHLLVKAIDEAFLHLDWRQPDSDSFYASAAESRRILKERLVEIPRGPRPQITAVGHCHIDVAWLWRIQHSRQKSARSFATALSLMERFPEYVFLQSQPQLYAYLKKDFPDLYERIKERVKVGNWEPTGAMWLESDCNIPSGESLVRQIMTGKRFFREEFGVDNRVLWLPDVFGYSWALPQILKKSGIDYFMTTKISWSQYNRFPNDTFSWRGIDGTEILTHFITTPDSKGSTYYTYNGNVTGESIQGLWNNYRQKDLNDNLLLAFGWGDGGGGPTRDMLEALRRYEDMPGALQVKPGRAENYFAKLEERVKDHPQLPLWDGELYLEYHRGTYTSQGWIKIMNRRMEYLLHQAEFLNAFALALDSEHAYPTRQLSESWEIVLRNQFHDIIPGSSIHEVYEDSRQEYREAEKLVLSTMQTGLAGIENAISAESTELSSLEGAAIRIYNALGWERSFPVSIELAQDGLWSWYSVSGTKLESQQDVSHPGRILVQVESVPAYGYTTIFGRLEVQPDEVKQSSEDPAPTESDCAWSIGINQLETPFYTIRLNKIGQLYSIYDKRANREVLKVGEPANVLQVFEDKPLKYDAWDIDIFYQDKMTIVDDLQEITILEEGPLRGVLKLVYRYQSSIIEQQLIVYKNHPRIDFKTRVLWHEHQQLLKAAFPVQIRSTKATYEIQFGNVERTTHWNTSWDVARFESVAQRWVDLSEGGYGVSLLNDGKYGHDIRNHVIRMSLIKSAINPDPEADQGEHVFTYSLLPHCGSWYEGRTHEAACELNAPLLTVPIEAARGPNELGMLRIDARNVMIDTIKKAENGKELIVRLYEFGGIRTNAALEINPDLGTVRSAQETNLLEEPEIELSLSGQRIAISLAPYEIKTLKLALDRFS